MSKKKLLNVNPIDKYEHTPLYDAIHSNKRFINAETQKNFEEIINELKKNNGVIVNGSLG